MPLKRRQQPFKVQMNLRRGLWIALTGYSRDSKSLIWPKASIQKAPYSLQRLFLQQFVGHLSRLYSLQKGIVENLNNFPNTKKNLLSFSFGIGAPYRADRWKNEAKKYCAIFYLTILFECPKKKQFCVLKIQTSALKDFIVLVPREQFYKLDDL